MEKVLHRTTFATRRLLEFFSEPELTMQIGHDRDLWATAILKQLTDNALDACEKAGVPPHIQVVVEDSALSVQDNGPGLPADTLEHRRALSLQECELRQVFLLENLTPCQDIL